MESPGNPAYRKFPATRGDYFIFSMGLLFALSGVALLVITGSMLVSVPQDELSLDQWKAGFLAAAFLGAGTGMMRGIFSRPVRRSFLKAIIYGIFGFAGMLAALTFATSSGTGAILPGLGIAAGLICAGFGWKFLLAGKP